MDVATISADAAAPPPIDATVDPLDSAPPPVDAAVPADAAVPDVGVPDVGVPDSVAPDVAAPDVAPPDAAGATNENYVFECESGRLFGALVRGSDAQASGGAYLHLPPGSAPWIWDVQAPALPPGRVELDVTLSRGGTYVVWVRVLGLTNGQDALYAGFQKADLRRFYPTTLGGWVWTRTAGNNDLERLRFDGLAAGPHTLVIGPGESGARCDRVVVTSDLSFTPPSP